NDVPMDAGSSISTSVQVLSGNGVCDEKLWPYDITKFAVQPPANCYAASAPNKAITYKKVANAIIPSLLKQCIADGFPFIFGFTVYESFESDQVATTGIVPMPSKDATGNINEQVVGGHAVMAVAYDDSKKAFKCRNSWGTNWGQKGYFWIPYDYLTNTFLASDFWTVELINDILNLN
ncbi:MAG: C1 family peptidase, partial [Thaumarchaeota archaeon]|nr:C1 family peptidase [Nitrososphaerota archaeon]